VGERKREEEREGGKRERERGRGGRGAEMRDENRERKEGASQTGKRNE